MTASTSPDERVPLPEGLTRLSGGALRADGVDGIAVISPASGTGSRPVPVGAGLRVLQALGGAHLPTVGPTTSGVPSTATGRPGLGRAATALPEGAPGAGDSWGGAGRSTEEFATRAAEKADGELLETGVWEDPDESSASGWGAEGDGGEGVDAVDSANTADSADMVPEYPEPEPGSGRRRRGARRSLTTRPVGSGGPLTADTPTASDNSQIRQPQPVRAPQALEALPRTEVVPASETALVAAPPVRASICPQGHANPPEARECLSCSQPLMGVFSYVRRPALATLTLSTGAAVEVAGDVVVGRAPQPQPGDDPHVVTLIAVPSHHHKVSRSHLMLTTSGWSILAQDLGSSNGTVLARPGATPVLLGAGMPTPVFREDLMDIGDGVTLRIDPPAWMRQQHG